MPKKKDGPFYERTRSRSSLFFEVPADDKYLIQNAFPEWVDAEINSEQWDAVELFEDPQHELILIPSPLIVSEWKRPSQIFVEEPPFLYADVSRTDLDMITSNEHLMKSPLMMWIITALGTVHYITLTEHSGAENEVAGKQTWQPWHNVYSMCKAGKHAPHHPVINPHGKYVVRLYHMGSWRKIVVDDRIPIDRNGNILLPRTERKSELWPMILSKALLKLVFEGEGHNAVTYLTGWLCREISLETMTLEVMWQFFHKVLQDYSTSHEHEHEHEHESKDSHDTAIVDENTLGNPTMLYGVMCDLHPFLAVQTRNVPLPEQIKKQEVKEWKRLRWLEWAKKNKRLIDTFAVNPMKYVKVISYCNNCRHSVLDNTPYVEIEHVEEVSVEKSEVKNVPSDTKNVTVEITPQRKPRMSRTPSELLLQRPGRKMSTRMSSAEITKKTPTKESADHPPLISKVLSGLFAGKPSKPKEIFNSSDIRKSVKFLDVTKKVRDVAAVSASKEDKTKTHLRTLKIAGQTLGTLSMQIIKISTFWADLYKMYPRIRSLYMYHRIVTIPNTAIVTNLVSEVKKHKGVNSDHPQDTTFKEFKSLKWSTTSKSFKNDCFYVCFESQKAQTVLISLTVMPKVLLNLKNVETMTNEKIVRRESSGVEGYLIMERYDWKTSYLSEATHFLKTQCSKTTAFHLDEGRYLWRVWLTCESGYFLRFCSNSTVLVFKKDAVSDVMKFDCEKLIKFGTLYGHLFSTLIHNFGRHQEYNVSLRKLYHHIDTAISVKKHRRFINRARAALHDAIFRETLLGIQFYMDDKREEEFEAIVRSLRVLLMRVDITAKPQHLWESARDTSSTLYLSQKILHDKAMFIQNYLRRFRLKKMKQLHDPNKKQFKMVQENLKKVDEVLLPGTKNNAIILHILWNTFKERHPNLLKICHHFEQDFEFWVTTEEYAATFSLSSFNIPKNWVPIIHAKIYCHSPDPVLCAIEFNCFLPKWFVRVYDNDTLLEMPRLIHSVLPSYYSRNKRGYTLLAYAICDLIPTDVHWRLQLISGKGTITPHICHHPKKTPFCNTPKTVRDFKTHSLHVTYTPNSNDLLFRLLVKVTEDSVVSFWVGTSSEEVHFDVKVLKKSGDIISETEGHGKAILPFVFLEFDKSDQENIYILESKVLRKSWPLTRKEWFTILNPTRRDLIDIRAAAISTTFILKPTHASKKHYSEQVKKDNTSRDEVYAPTVYIQMVSESDNHPLLTLDDRVKSYVQKIIQEKDKDKYVIRKKRGMAARQNFRDYMKRHEPKSGIRQSLTKTSGGDERTVEPPPEIRPPSYLNKYLQAHYFDDGLGLRLKSNEDVKQEWKQREEDIKNEEKKCEDIVKQREEYLQHETVRQNSVMTSLRKIREDRQAELNRAYQLRDEYVKNSKKSFEQTSPSRKPFEQTRLSLGRKQFDQTRLTLHRGYSTYLQTHN